MCERWDRVESPSTYLNRMSFTRPFLLGPVFFRTALPCSGGYHLERGGMPLHDAVGIIKMALLLKIKEHLSSVWAKRCVCYLTSHDYPSFVEGESLCILLLLFRKLKSCDNFFYNKTTMSFGCEMSFIHKLMRCSFLCMYVSFEQV